MARKQEDYDEFCDPDNPKILKYEEVLDATERIRPLVINTPLVVSKSRDEFAIHLYYKLDFLQKTGSFKERGAMNLLQQLPPEKKKIGVVIACIGNFAISLSYCASKMHIPVTVVVPNYVPVDVLQRCHGYGAKVLVQGTSVMESQKYARAIARDKGLTYVNSRDHPDILAGYGSMAVEIMDQIPFVDAIIVPVGTGGLASAVVTVVKHIKPTCLVYGVQPESMPVMFQALENGEPVVVAKEHTLAHGISVPMAGVNSFAMIQPVMDKMLLVKEDWIARSILHLAERERYVVEGAGACPLAAIIGSLVPELKTKNVVCILSGGNIDNLLLTRCLDRGLSAEGRLVKFSVGIKDTSEACTQLLKLLANGGYNVVQHFRHREWVDDDVYNVQMKLTCETLGLEHALELKRFIEKAYPCTTEFETEPFNDKRTCPCYVRKTMCS